MRSTVAVALVIVVLIMAAPIAWLPRDMPVARAADDGTEIAQLKAEIEELKARLPSQSHAMMDVDYHFANLWFAGKNKNWPLAQFYLNETRSHLRWAVRIIPVRRVLGGEIDLRGLLEAVDRTALTELGKAIADRHGDGFIAAYRRTLEGCYSCHKASDKPYLRPRIPEQPPSRIINFDPATTWP
jgi:cytochrome c553